MFEAKFTAAQVEFLKQYIDARYEADASSGGKHLYSIGLGAPVSTKTFAKWLIETFDIMRNVEVKVLVDKIRALTLALGHRARAGAGTGKSTGLVRDMASRELQRRLRRMSVREVAKLIMGTR